MQNINSITKAYQQAGHNWSYSIIRGKHCHCMAHIPCNTEHPITCFTGRQESYTVHVSSELNWERQQISETWKTRDVTVCKHALEGPLTPKESPLKEKAISSDRQIKPHFHLDDVLGTVKPSLTTPQGRIDCVFHYSRDDFSSVTSQWKYWHLWTNHLAEKG